MSNDFFKRWSEKKQQADSYYKDSDHQDSNHQEAQQLSDAAVEIEFEVETQDTERDSDKQEWLAQQEPLTNGEDENTAEQASVATLLKDAKVDKALKKAALRSLFHQPEFNVVDGLNDYDHDYAAVKDLSVDVAQTLRDWVNQEAQQNEDVESLHQETEPLVAAQQGSDDPISLDDCEEKQPTELATEQTKQTEPNTVTNNLKNPKLTS
ncbi:DUF3306 domain-containing protein [Vibrio hippocampi]|uniref:DUF3306 domain-containing protein n=1 Tax=Vibrio hippocampi TaxID=654686 RepID=A0ABM8ZGZ4_9VIBR|nr:DUF3306 domain-containing protein [Vibrio hippocampi]CAH0525961.1 hypothetical protein VHP8226_01443 [Vibrio hippocampi]